MSCNVVDGAAGPHLVLWKLTTTFPSSWRVNLRQHKEANRHTLEDRLEVPLLLVNLDNRHKAEDMCVSSLSNCIRLKSLTDLHSQDSSNINHSRDKVHPRAKADQDNRHL